MNTEDLSVGLRGEDLACRGDLDFRGEDFRLAAKAIRAFVRIRAFVDDSSFRGEDFGLSCKGIRTFVEKIFVGKISGFRNDSFAR